MPVVPEVTLVGVPESGMYGGPVDGPRTLPTTAGVAVAVGVPGVVAGPAAMAGPEAGVLSAAEASPGALAFCASLTAWSMTIGTEGAFPP